MIFRHNLTLLRYFAAVGHVSEITSIAYFSLKKSKAIERACQCANLNGHRSRLTEVPALVTVACLRHGRRVLDTQHVGSGLAHTTRVFQFLRFVAIPVSRAVLLS